MNSKLKAKSVQRRGGWVFPPPVKCARHSGKFVNIYALSFGLTTFNDNLDMQQHIRRMWNV